MPGRPGKHPRSPPQRGPGLPGEQPGRDPRAAHQDCQHAGVSPAVEAGDGFPAGWDSVFGFATTANCE